MITEQAASAYLEIFSAIETAEENFHDAISDDNARHAVRDMTCSILATVFAQLEKLK